MTHLKPSLNLTNFFFFNAKPNLSAGLTHYKPNLFSPNIICNHFRNLCVLNY